jgi:peptidoglycan-N-acetylglucosamine deacetylase
MNILTFDLEDWYHLLDYDSTKTEGDWIKFESRIEGNVERILEFLKTNDQKATFFCLGWICRKYPQLVRKISDLGFEIGCHSDMHQLIYEQDRATFRTDLEHAIVSIEDCTGKKVDIYRAPGFSLTCKTQWVFEILAESGIKTDSSIFPAQRGHGGFPEIPFSEPFVIRMNGLEILEFPVNVFPFLGRKIVFSGGGYFRLFPYGIIKAWSRRSPYIMMYFHPRDFDPDHPVIPGLPLIRRFKSYYGLNEAFSKLRRWTEDFPFTDIGTARMQIDTTQLKTLIFPLAG